MPRSNGEFPNYTKLNISPEKWPEDYWDTNRTCVNCGKCWPNTHLFQICIDCNHKALKKEGPPDVRWPEAVFALLEKRFNELYDIWNESIEDEQLAWEDVKTHGKLDSDKVSQAVDNMIDQSRTASKQR